VGLDGGDIAAPQGGGLAALVRRELAGLLRLVAMACGVDVDGAAGENLRSGL